MTFYIAYKIWKILKIKSACMHVSSRSHLLLIWVQNLIPEHRLMITTIERYGRENSCWLLIAAHTSGLYEKSTRSPDLISLLGSASLHEDLLLDWSGSFLQIFRIFLEVEDRLLEEMKRWKKDGEKNNFFLIFSLIFSPPKAYSRTPYL